MKIASLLLGRPAPAPQVGEPLREAADALTAEALGLAYQIENPRGRAEALLGIASSLSEEEERLRVYSDAADAARQMPLDRQPQALNLIASEMTRRPKRR